MTVNVFPGGTEFFISATLPLSMNSDIISLKRSIFYEALYEVLAVPTLAKNCRLLFSLLAGP